MHLVLDEFFKAEYVCQNQSRQVSEPQFIAQNMNPNIILPLWKQVDAAPLPIDHATEVGRAPLIIFNFAIYWLGLSIWTLQDTWEAKKLKL